MRSGNGSGGERPPSLLARIGRLNLILSVGVFIVMAPPYGAMQALGMAGLVLVILVGYHRLASRFIDARRDRDR